ncbi:MULTISPECIES: alpha/beta fold hydrolase [unclassified Amycolatopsis]|uniref:alpha/beta fold hydrolase n=1 Tax=unclassified Amycolatopsis TaxID=2618356 RepID=UPI001C6A603D|nr:alpha/beta hydrolase [Amycolatopsis sp. DSM 110486]QYN25550.1 alpha/beta hydrolase [Amycolatopsis sp. DSM 110486]
MNRWKITAAAAAGALALGGVIVTTASADPAQPAHAAVADSHKAKPTIVLVSGAFEESASWTGEITQLRRAGYQAIAPAVPLRGVASDAAYLTTIVRSVTGPVVLVGHSFGGNLITEVAAQDPAQVKALVYTAAFIPKAGESAGQLLAQFPGSLLGPDTTYTVNYPGGASDTYVKPESFRSLFAGDRSTTDAAVDAATQRPINSSALGEPAAAGVPTGIPVYAIVAAQDKAIPPAAERWEAQRAGATVYTVNSAHDLPTSHPTEVTQVIERAAR